MTELSEEDVHPSTLAYKNDYTIDEEKLETKVQMASIPSLIILAILSISLTTIMVSVILNYYNFGLNRMETVIISFLITFVVFIAGGLGGFTWQFIGHWVASNTYKIYTNKFDVPFFKYLGRIYLKFAGRNSVIYLEGEALDVNYRDVFSRLTFVITIGISQLSFFLLYLTYVWNPIFANSEFLQKNIFPNYNLEFQIILSLASSLGTLAFYLPATFIIRDANIRLWNSEKREIGQPLQTVRSAIQSFIGITAILTGWGLYQNLTQNNELLVIGYIIPNFEVVSFAFLLDYFVSLIIVVILTSPIIYPAAATYNYRHSQNVNKFRTGAILSGVEVGISKIRIPTREEKTNIGEYINKNLV